MSNTNRRSFLGLLCGGVAATALAPVSKVIRVKRELILPESEDALLFEAESEQPLVVTGKQCTEQEAEIVAADWYKKKGLLTTNPTEAASWFAADLTKVNKMSDSTYESFLHDHLAINRKYDVQVTMAGLYHRWNDGTLSFL